MQTSAWRIVAPVLVFLFNTGLTVSGWVSTTVALICWGLMVPVVAVARFWPQIQARLEAWGIPTPLSAKRQLPDAPEPNPDQATSDNLKAQCFHLADELEDEYKRYEDDEQKIVYWASGLVGRESESDYDQQVGNAQDENFMRTLGKYDRDLKGRLLNLYDALEPTLRLGAGDRSRIENLAEPRQMRDLAERLREVCGKFSGNLDALRADELRQRIARWRTEIQNGNFKRTPLGDSPFTATNTYQEMKPWLLDHVRDRFQSPIQTQRLFDLARKKPSPSDKDVLLGEVARIEKEWGLL